MLQNVAKHAVQRGSDCRVPGDLPALRPEGRRQDPRLPDRWVSDPDPGSGAFLTAGSGMDISESLETVLWVRILLNFLMRIWDGNHSDPEWKNLDPGCLSRIPQHCFYISLARDHTLFTKSLDPDQGILVNPYPDPCLLMTEN